MTSARDEFEEWRQHKLAERARERDALSARRQEFETRRPAPRSAGAVGEEIARDLKAFLQRHRCVEGTLEMVRRGAPQGSRCRRGRLSAWVSSAWLSRRRAPPT